MVAVLRSVADEMEQLRKDEPARPLLETLKEMIASGRPNNPLPVEVRPAGPPKPHSRCKNPVQHLAHVDRAFAPAVPARWEPSAR